MSMEGRVESTEAEQPRVTGEEIEAAVELGRAITRNIASSVEVRSDVVGDLVVALLAEGHVLIEDLPGVGKTTLARSLARSVDLEFARVQCTADLLPADVVGVNVFNQREDRFEFRPGPIFANVVLVDEINRASPKTQSGLLECMQERRVTVDVHTHELARPFVVLATQNPVEFEGTYPLPEAQVDRFTMRLSLGYPSAAGEADMLAAHEHGDRVADLEPVADAPTLLAAQDATMRVHASPALRQYVVSLLGRTRSDPRVELGASPRAGLMLLRAAKARALLQGRDHALPDDVQQLAEAVLSHRLVLTPEALDLSGEQVVADAVAATPAMWGRRARHRPARTRAGAGRRAVRRRAAVGARGRPRAARGRRGRPGCRSGRAGCACGGRVGPPRRRGRAAGGHARHPRGHAAAADGPARRPAAGGAGRARDRAPPVADQDRCALRPPRPPHAGGAEDRGVRPAVARDPDGPAGPAPKTAGRTRCSCSRGSSASGRREAATTTAALARAPRRHRRGRHGRAASAARGHLRRAHLLARGRARRRADGAQARGGGGRPPAHRAGPAGRLRARGPRRRRARRGLAHRPPRAHRRLLAAAARRQAPDRRGADALRLAASARPAGRRPRREAARCSRG